MVQHPFSNKIVSLYNPNYAAFVRSDEERKQRNGKVNMADFLREQYDLQPNQVLFLDDSTHNINALDAAGFRTSLITNGLTGTKIDQIRDLYLQ